MFKKRHIAMAVAGLFAAQGGVASAWDDDAALLSDSSSTSSQQLTVFNPDGSSYAITPVDIQVATIEPVLVASSEPLIIAAPDGSLPDQVTVFDPSGLSYSLTSDVQYAMLEPMDVYVASDAFMYDPTFEPVAAIDPDADSRPVYVAHFVSTPEWTGALEEGLS